MQNEGKTIKQVVEKRPAEHGRFAAALGVADGAIIWASPAGDGFTWNVMFAKTPERNRNTPLFIVQVWAAGGEVEVISEPREIGTFGEFSTLINLLSRMQGGGNERVH